MAKDIAIKIAKGLLFVLSRALVIILVVALVYVAFYASMNTMNVNMIIKDAFTRRADYVLVPDEDGADWEMLNKLFTQRALQSDTLISNNVYQHFDIYNFYQRTDVETHIVWPWQDKITVQVTDMVLDITGKYITEEPEEEVVGSVETEQANKQNDLDPPKWVNALYEVELVNRGDSWKINSMKFIETVEEPVTLEIDEDGVPTTQDPDYSASPSPSPTPSEAS